MTATHKKKFIITRSFKASKEAVFNAFSKAESLAQWWGPKGMSIQVLQFEFQPKGRFHYKMESNGQAMFGLFVYGNIVRPDLIEFVNSFSDEAGNICKAPFPIDFPLEIFNELTLTEKDGQTTLTLQGHPINATEAQEDTYYGMTESMNQGFGGTLDQLEAYLAR